MSSRLIEKKLEEAESLMKEADKCASRTLTRWKPDWENACPFYEQAGNCFKNAKAYNQAKDAFKKAHVGFKNMNILFSASKCLELAAAMASEEKSFLEASQLYQQASLLYRKAGDFEDKAADCLVKAAKATEEVDPDNATKLCSDACDIFEQEEKYHFALPIYKYAISLHLKGKRYEEALEVLKRHMRAAEQLKQFHDLNKICLSIVLIHLQRNDFIGAERAFEEFTRTTGFSDSQEGKACQELLQAFDKGSNEDIKSITGYQLFNFLDQQVIRIAKNLRIPEGVQRPSKNQGINVEDSEVGKGKEIEGGLA